MGIDETNGNGNEGKFGGRESYTEEEKKLGRDFCKTINDDEKLKGFFVDFSGKMLEDFAMDMDRAFKRQDSKRGMDIMNETIDKMRALTTFMHIKVVMRGR